MLDSSIPLIINSFWLIVMSRHGIEFIHVVWKCCTTHNSASFSFSFLVKSNPLNSSITIFLACSCIETIAVAICYFFSLIFLFSFFPPYLSYLCLEYYNKTYDMSIHRILRILIVSVPRSQRGPKQPESRQVSITK